MSQSIKIIKNRSDIGAGTRGADMGIDALEVAAINQGNDFFQRYPFLEVPTRNESVYKDESHPYAKRIQEIIEQCTSLSQTVKDTINDGYFPLVLSGDHSSAFGTITGIKKAFPDKTVGVIWIDAHADLHSPYTSPSGNLHGMPLAAALQCDNIDLLVNNPGLNTIEQWEQLKKLGNHGRKLLPAHLVYFGLRDLEEQEESLIQALQIKTYTVTDVRMYGTTYCADQALEQLQACDIIYISFDVDSMDCELISNGTGTPVKKGFSANEISSLLKLLISSRKVICMEVVEINPLLDNKGNRMAETAFDILNEVVPCL